MNTINDIFIHVLQQHLKSSARGTKSRIAEASGLTRQKFNNILSGIRVSSEEERRTIAEYLGYHSYEAFLDVGRKALGLPTMAEEAASVANQVPPWLKPMLNDLSNLDEHGQRAVKALVDGFKK